MQKTVLTRATALMLTLAAPLPTLAQEATLANLTGVEWQLLAVDGVRFAPGTTLTYEADGKFYGQAPCNRYFGQNTATLPALALGPAGATMMACPALEAEGVFLRSLDGLREARVEEGHLLLTGAEGAAPVLEFVADLGDKALICKTCKN